jgi:hypothetical protein
VSVSTLTLHWLFVQTGGLASLFSDTISFLPLLKEAVKMSVIVMRKPTYTCCMGLRNSISAALYAISVMQVIVVVRNVRHCWVCLVELTNFTLKTVLSCITIVCVLSAVPGASYVSITPLNWFPIESNDVEPLTIKRSDARITRNFAAEMHTDLFCGLLSIRTEFIYMFSIAIGFSWFAGLTLNRVVWEWGAQYCGRCIMW